MAQELKVNTFWGRRSGYWEVKIPKGHNSPFGLAFRQGQWSSGRERKGEPKKCTLRNVNKGWFK